MTFARILGHDQQKDILRRALNTGRLAHAYLFEGPEGVGKRLMAMALSRAVFCSEGSGCGSCAPCRKIDHNNHPDLHLLEPDGTTIKIEQVRELQQQLSLRPLEAPRKICIIDGADWLNTAAGNALLKTLEEPSGSTLLLLLSAHAEGVLPTIRSRCQRLPFGRLPQPLVREALREMGGGDGAEAHILAALSDGSFKKALGKNRDLYLEQRKRLIKSVTALSPGSIIPLFDLATELAEDKEHLPEILEIFQSFFRDMLLHRHGAAVEELVNIDLLEKIERLQARETVRSLLGKLDALTACRRHLERNVNRQLAVEVLLLNLTSPGPPSGPLEPPNPLPVLPAA